MSLPVTAQVTPESGGHGAVARQTSAPSPPWTRPARASTGALGGSTKVVHLG